MSINRYLIWVDLAATDRRLKCGGCIARRPPNWACATGPGQLTIDDLKMGRHDGGPSSWGGLDAKLKVWLD